MGSDEELLAAAASGDDDAFACFYRRHVAAITTYFRRRVPSPDLAFDLAAETFSSVVVGLEGFDPDRGSARGWLFGIATNQLRQLWRRQQVDERARRALALAPIHLDDDALRRVDEMTIDGQLTEALAALSDLEREAVLAHVVEERSYEELAAELSCSTAVVRQRVSRGLARLRTATAEDA